MMFFSGSESLYRTLVVGILAYAALIILLRLSGNRTLSKMNAFDMIVTVALGSTLATVLLTKQVALADGVLALALLIALQYAITWSSVRFKSVRRMVTGEPVLLLYRGELLADALRRSRVTADEVMAAARESGSGHLDALEAVVLETDGSLSVVQRSEASGASTLAGVKGTSAQWNP